MTGDLRTTSADRQERRSGTPAFSHRRRGLCRTRRTPLRDQAAPNLGGVLEDARRLRRLALGVIAAAVGLAPLREGLLHPEGHEQPGRRLGDELVLLHPKDLAGVRRPDIGALHVGPRPVCVEYGQAEMRELAHLVAPFARAGVVIAHRLTLSSTTPWQQADVTNSGPGGLADVRASRAGLVHFHAVVPTPRAGSNVEELGGGGGRN